MWCYIIYLDITEYRNFVCNDTSNLKALIDEDTKAANITLSELGLIKGKDDVDLATHCGMPIWNSFSLFLTIVNSKIIFKVKNAKLF